MTLAHAAALGGINERQPRRPPDKGDADMGAAAYNRGSMVLSRALDTEHSARVAQELRDREAQIGADCEAFTRAALAFIVEPTGLRAPAVQKSKTMRGWPKRHAALVAAHNEWASNPTKHNAVTRAQAAYALLVFAVGGWTIPNHIAVPRAAMY